MMDTLSLIVPILLAPVAGGPPTPKCALAVAAPAEVRAVAVAADGAAIAAASADRMVRLWDVPACTERVAFKLSAPVSEIAFTPDRGRLATLASGLELWDAHNGKRVQALPDVSAFQMAFAANGTLAVAGHRLGLRDAETLRAGPVAAEQSGWLNTCVAFSGNGTLVAAGDTAGNFWVWDAATCTQRLRRKGHDNRVTGVGFIDDGRTVISGGSDGRMKFWDLKTGRELGVIFPHRSAGLGRGIGSLVCTPDGRMIITGGADEPVIRLWEAATGQLRATLPTKGTSVASLSIALDGSTIAAGGKGSSGGAVTAWQLYTSGSTLTSGVPPTLWQDLSADSPRAFHAILRVSAHPHQAVALLRERLHPVKLDAAVRKECDVLIGRLDHDRFEVREQAQNKLEAMTPWVEAYLKQAMAGAKTLELQRRLQSVLGKVRQSTLPLVRAVEALEHAQGSEARQLLQELADGEPNARITRDARQALQRLEAR
jgi:hypothetical protein